MEKEKKSNPKGNSSSKDNDNSKPAKVVSARKRKTRVSSTPMGKKVSKLELVALHLQLNKKITSWEAIDLYGATRLAAIIYTLRNRPSKKRNQLYVIESEEKRMKERYGNVAKYVIYRLIKIQNPKPKTI